MKKERADPLSGPKDGKSIDEPPIRDPDLPCLYLIEGGITKFEAYLIGLTLILAFATVAVVAIRHL